MYSVVYDSALTISELQSGKFYGTFNNTGVALGQS